LIATGWTEQRAIWGKGETDTLEQIKQIEKTLPFPLLGFDCDNGGEFLNYHLLKHFTKRDHPVHFTRSRAYHKDDNAHVEQKNWTHVRQWLGYQRLDDPRVVPLLKMIWKPRRFKTNEQIFNESQMPSFSTMNKNRAIIYRGNIRICLFRMNCFMSLHVLKEGFSMLNKYPDINTKSPRPK
jgi:5S rRNA maturation endonuclease (ribonuclease M5)